MESLDLIANKILLKYYSYIQFSKEVSVDLLEDKVEFYKKFNNSVLDDKELVECMQNHVRKLEKKV